MSDPAQLYEADFYRWTQEQASLLRQVPSERINLPIDWRNAADEIEDMGRKDLRSVNRLIGVIFEHLLKLEHSPAADPRDGWIETVSRSRDEIQRILDDSPSMQSKLSGRSQREYGRAREHALRSLAGRRRPAEHPDQAAVLAATGHGPCLVASESPRPYLLREPADCPSLTLGVWPQPPPP